MIFLAMAKSTRTWDAPVRLLTAATTTHVSNTKRLTQADIVSDIGLAGLVWISKTKWLARFGRREGIADKSLREPIERAENGLVDAGLGGGIIKHALLERATAIRRVSHDRWLAREMADDQLRSGLKAEHEKDHDSPFGAADPSHCRAN